MDRETYFKSLQRNLTMVALNLQNCHKSLLKFTLELSDYDDYTKYTTDNNIPLKLSTSGVDNEISMEYFSLSGAIMKLTSSMLLIANKDINSDIITNANTKFIRMNGEDEIAIAIDNSLEFYFFVIFA